MSAQDTGKKAINRAGKILVSDSATPEEKEAATKTVGVWRSLHVLPMGVIATDLRRKCSRVDSRAFVAERLKRMESIIAKLGRKETGELPGMSLWNMQDIGGCRAVLPSLNTVRMIESMYSDGPYFPIRKKDYITEPRDSGYRGVHLILKYAGAKPSEFDGMQIEVQLRSRHQHVFATAVETVGYFTKQSLKSSVGETRWLRFFSLMGSLAACKEGTPLVPGTPDNPYDVLMELRPLAVEVQRDLSAFMTTVHQSEAFRHQVNSDFYLLLLHPNRPSSWGLQGFSRKDLDKAMNNYADAEAQGFNAVLVSTDSLESLWKAYPNYFLDLRAFVGGVQAVIDAKVPTK